MAEYWITEVHHGLNNSIAEVRAYPNDPQSPTLGKRRELSRADVLRMMPGDAFYTAIIKPGHTGYTRQALVIPVPLGGRYYIKTVRDNTTADNLGNLPTY